LTAAALAVVGVSAGFAPSCTGALAAQKVVEETYFASVHSGENRTLAMGWHPQARLRSSWSAVAFYGPGQDPATWPGDYINPNWNAAKFADVVYNDPPCVDYFVNGDGTPTANGAVHPAVAADFTCTDPDWTVSLQQISENTVMLKGLIAAEGYYYTDMLTLGFVQGRWQIITKSTTEQGPTVASPYWIERKQPRASSSYAEGGAKSIMEIASVAAQYLDALHSRNLAVLEGILEENMGVYSVDEGDLKVEMKKEFMENLPAANTAVAYTQFDKVLEVSKNSMRGSITTVQYRMKAALYNENLSIYDFGTNGLSSNADVRDWKIMSITKGKSINGKANMYRIRDVGNAEYNVQSTFTAF